MILAQKSANGQLRYLAINGSEEELKQLAFFLMDAIDNEHAEFSIGNTYISVACNHFEESSSSSQ